MDHAGKRLLGEALLNLVEAARAGGPVTRIGLMCSGSELGPREFVRAAAQAKAEDGRLTVVGIGPRPEGVRTEDWIETPDCERDIAQALMQALRTGAVEGAVALHYPFPLGVCTVGRISTPGRGEGLFLSSTTGLSASSGLQAWVRNTIYGVAVAKAFGIAEPKVGLVNLEGASAALRSLQRMRERGWPLHLGASRRADGGSLLRGNDLLNPDVDVAVCDSLTGNVLMKVFSAFTTGGGYEAAGWGYGPSAGEDWPYVVSIVSRASGANVIAGALRYTAAMARAGLPGRVAAELALAGRAGLDEELSAATRDAGAGEAVAPPAAVPTDTEIHGIDVLDIENAVRSLWRRNIYAESAMGCTGPVVKVAAVSRGEAEEALRNDGYL
jgi:betaine reductase